MRCATFQLAGDDGGATAHTIIEQLQQVAALVRGNGCQRKVVDQQQIEARELREAAREAAVAVRHKQLLQKREAHVYNTLWPARAACCPRAQSIGVERYADAPLQETPAGRAKRSGATGRTSAAAGQRYWAIGGVQNAAKPHRYGDPRELLEVQAALFSTLRVAVSDPRFHVNQ